MSRNNPKEKRPAVADGGLNSISPGTQIVGDMVTKGDLRIEGSVYGTVICEAKLVVGENGRIEGRVLAQNAYIAGRVKGEVVVKELLQLQEKGHIEGDIYTQKLSVQVGAHFTGNCRMGADGKHNISSSADSLKPFINKEILRDTAGFNRLGGNGSSNGNGASRPPVMDKPADGRKETTV